MEEVWKRRVALALTLSVIAILCLLFAVSVKYSSVHLPHIPFTPGSDSGSGSGSAAGTKIGVVVSILPEADFVRHVGGDRVEVTVMVPPGASPHTYEPLPEQLKRVSRAKLYFMVGSGIEFERNWMEKIRAINPDMMVVNTSEGIRIIENDPHVWNSPPNAEVMVANICNALVQIDPANASFYENNRDAYLHELDELDAYFRHKLDPARSGNRARAFMCYHPAFGYLAAEYNLTQITIEHGGKEPTARVIRDCVDKARRYHLHYIFVAPQSTTAECIAIASEIGGEIAYMDPLPENYTASMYHIADLLAEEFAE